MPKVLTPKIIKQVANLARLSENPSEEFIDKYGVEIGAILEYVDELQLVDTSNIDPLDGARICLVSNLREDEESADKKTYSRVRSNIIANFPNSQGDLLVVPGVFE